MANEQPKIDIKVLAKEIADGYFFYITDKLTFSKTDEIDIINDIECHAAKVTPEGMIISEGSFKDVFDILQKQVIIELHSRLTTIIENMEEKDELKIQQFGIQVEQDGY